MSTLIIGCNGGLVKALFRTDKSLITDAVIMDFDTEDKDKEFLTKIKISKKKTIQAVVTEQEIHMLPRNSEIEKIFKKWSKTK